MTKNEKINNKVAILAINALLEYADPSFYHAISFAFDRPSGGFADDFEKNHGDDDYDRPMPGKAARKALKKIKNILDKAYPERLINKVVE